MPRTRKNYFVSIESTVVVTAGYEVLANTLEDALRNAETLFKNEFDVSLESCHDSGFYFQDIDVDASEVE